MGAHRVGASARPSAASSPRASPGSSGRPERCSSTASPVDPDRAARALLPHTPSRAHGARPGRGVPHRHGRPAGLAGPGLLAGPGRHPLGMVRTMAQTPQPSFLSSWLSSFSLLRRSARLGGEPVRRARAWRHRRTASSAGVAVSSSSASSPWASSVPGRLGARRGPGVPRRTGTDPNSMLPMFLLFVGGYVAIFRVARATSRSRRRAEPARRRATRWWERRDPVLRERAPWPPSLRWPSCSSALRRWRWLPSTRTPTRS